MSRNTNINELLFDVSCESVFLENHKNPIHGYKAVTGVFENNQKTIFSIVSDNYQLISNKEAIELGKYIHSQLFPNASSESFEIFNIIAPKTKGSCHIDIIDKNYTMNIWEQEVYVPFIRIQNSYNRTYPLQFQIGFCRKLCDNGVIFEKNLVSISIIHTRQSIRNIDLSNIDVSHLKSFETDFINKTKKSVEIELPRKYFLPLAAKVLNRNFDLNEKNRRKREATEQRLNEFTCAIEKYTDKYIRTELFGENAFTFFSVITDYASNEIHMQVRTKHEMQVKCGTWLSMVGGLMADPKFNWDEEVKDYNFMMSM